MCFVSNMCFANNMCFVNKRNLFHLASVFNSRHYQFLLATCSLIFALGKMFNSQNRYCPMKSTYTYFPTKWRQVFKYPPFCFKHMHFISPWKCSVPQSSHFTPSLTIWYCIILNGDNVLSKINMGFSHLDQVRGQDSWILAKFLWDKAVSQVGKIAPSCPLG